LRQHLHDFGEEYNVGANSESQLLLDDSPPSPPRVFEVKQEGETLLIVPVTNLGELGFEEIESEASSLLDLLNDSPARNVVLDFCRTDYFGSAALRFFLRLSKSVRLRNGRLALCNISQHEQEILKLTKLDSLWAICPSRAEAMRFVGRPAPTRR
jgi:anti-anti-sigma factor